MQELNKRIKELKQELEDDPTDYDSARKLSKLITAKEVLEEEEFINE